MLARQSDAVPALRIPIFGVDANPAIDPPILRKSDSYCAAEVSADRARWISDNKREGIHLLRVAGKASTELRGSREQSGCLTAHESQLNAEYFGSQGDVALLAREYETRLEKHILAGRRGSPRSCGVIAARVKTLLSSPDHVHL